MIELGSTTRRSPGALAALALLLAASGCNAASPSVLPSAASASQSPTEPPNTPSPTPTATTSTPSGWPYLTDPGRFNGATLVTDGRIYVAESGFDGHARLLAFEPDGSAADGWPVALDQAYAGELQLTADGRLLVLACAWRDHDECSLHRFGSGGQEEPGWPATLAGSCWLVGESDGRIYVGCSTDDVQSVTAIDADGRSVAGWPVSHSPGSVQVSTDGTLYVGSSYAESGAITAYGADGAVRPGWPVSIPPYTDFRVGDDARVYLWSYDGIPPDAQVFDAPNCVLAQQTIFSVLTAQGERLPGWPKSVEGSVGEPIEAPDGSLQVAVVDGTRTQLIRLDADTWPASLAGSGAGCYRGNGPWIGPDGSVYLVDQGSEGAAIVKADAQGQVEPGWPYRGEFDLYSAEGSLGASVFPPAFGPDGAVYVITYAPSDQYFEEVAVRAIGPDGQLRPGWPFIVEPLGCEGPACYVRMSSLTTMVDGSAVVVAHITEGSANGQQSRSVIWLLSPSGEPLT